MIKLTIEGAEYKGPFDWSEITLDKFIALCEIEIPDKLRALWQAAASGDNKTYDAAAEKITITETEKVFPTYYGKVIELLTTVPYDIIDRMYGALREEFFNKYLRHYIYSAFTTQPMILENGQLVVYRPPDITSFQHKGVKYMLPESLRIYGSEIPMAKETAVTFSEASDIEVALRHMTTGAADRIPMFVAVYCRPEGEQYNEAAALLREKLFHDLPMNVVWSVFFCMQGRKGGSYAKADWPPSAGAG
jgi:hypothetical protein